tara:strand:+ start:831 stop:1019 length:189 start_codon:yes stop_codon:yes gene_type:complete
MDFYHFLLALIVIFVLIMHNKPELFREITKNFKIKTSCLRPEVSIFELLIIVMLFMIIAKLY